MTHYSCDGCGKPAVKRAWSVQAEVGSKTVVIVAGIGWKDRPSAWCSDTGPDLCDECTITLLGKLIECLKDGYEEKKEPMAQ